MAADSQSLFGPSNALAVYGTLAPGEVNHHVVADIDGRWIDGMIRGRRFESTWSGMDGFPAFHPDPAGDPIPVRVLVCERWRDYWDRLDRFEGPGYRRVAIDVFTPDGDQLLGQAQVYECLAERPGRD